MPGAPAQPAVVTVGVFDGVHVGHRALVRHAREIADARGAEVVAVTFEPHPLAILAPERAPAHLAELELRRELLLGAGADRVEVLHFSDEVARWTPQQFVADYLVGALAAEAAVVGENFRFGAGAAGDAGTLAEIGAPLGLRAVPMALATAAGEPWSSSRIRSLLADGEVRGAAEGLGRWYRLEGTVVHGDHRGRELGYPTANLEWRGRPAIPADGVYAAWLLHGPDRLPAAVSVGTNPQFAGTDRRVEAYALDRDDLDLYGGRIGLEFVERIRGQQVFADVAGLVDRMALDVAAARAALEPA